MGNYPKAVGELSRFSVAALQSAASNQLGSKDAEHPNELGGFAWFWGTLADGDTEYAKWIFQPAPPLPGLPSAEGASPNGTRRAARGGEARLFGDYSGLAPY